MNEVSVFDKLVKNLSQSERQDMLERLRSKTVVSEEPIGIDEETEQYDITRYYEGIGIMQKIIIFLKMIFSGGKREEVILENILKRIGLEIITKQPDIINIKEGRFQPVFYHRIKELEKSARFFSPFLSKTWGGNRIDFIAFLAGMQIERVQQRILEETDPAYIADRNKGIELHELKRLLEMNLKENLESITTDEREKLYQDSKILHTIGLLASFPFDAILSEFNPGEKGDPVSVPAGKLVSSLCRLMNILSSFRIGPSATILESLFLFVYNDRLEDPQFDMEAELGVKISDALGALENIREFNQSVPLKQIIIYASGDLRYEPEPVSGGEDWFSLLKQFYEKRLQKKFKDYSMSRQLHEFLSDARHLTGIENILQFKIPEIIFKSGGGHHYYSLGLIKSFFTNIFVMKINKPLKILMIEGDFYKEENRNAYTDAYNDILKTSERIDNLQKRIGDEGDIGISLKKADEEVMPFQTRTKKRRMLAESFDRDARGLIQASVQNFHLLAEILNGILFGEVGGQYDTLSNLGQIEGRNNKKYMRELETVLTLSRQFISLLSDILQLEDQRKSYEKKNLSGEIKK
jgi:hypothetical protein